MIRTMISRHPILFSLSVVFVAPLSADTGRFAGNVAVQWLDEREADPSLMKMKLLEDFSFTGSEGKTWRAPKGAMIDGASLPGVFRAMIGPPFSGAQRKAAVIHDHYCRDKSEPWKSVHRMFYDAVRASGAEEIDAKIMYTAVYAAGPRWAQRDSSCFRSCHAAAASLEWKPVIGETELRPVMDWIAQENPGLDEIEQKVDATTKRPGPHLFAQGH
jgi:hypothetical protein